MAEDARIRWSVLLPVKVLAHAKSRLAALAGPRRGELALALACDTAAAVLGCDAAARVIAVTDDAAAGGALAALGVLVLADEPGDGLNAALRHRGAVRRPARAAASGDRTRAARGRGVAVGVRARRRRGRHHAVHRRARGRVPARVRPRVASQARCRRRGRTGARRRARAAHRRGHARRPAPRDGARPGAAHRADRRRAAQMCTTGQVSVLVIPGTDWMWVATSRPRSSTLSAWARTITS